MGDNWPVALFPSYSCAPALLVHKICSSGIHCNPRHRPTGQRSANQRISRKKKPKKNHKIMPPYVFLPRIQPRDLHFALSLSFRSFILTSSLSLSHYYPLLPYLYFNFLPSTCSILLFLVVILRRPWVSCGFSFPPHLINGILSSWGCYHPVSSASRGQRYAIKRKKILLTHGPRARLM